ncbi:hypothetical protein PSP6_710044 [Paraburkholderia tropica]|nr:hypothetical protein PSP6_710044 [Paraburkholderia tropica]
MRSGRAVCTWAAEAARLARQAWDRDSGGAWVMRWTRLALGLRCLQGRIGAGVRQCIRPNVSRSARSFGRRVRRRTKQA